MANRITAAIAAMPVKPGTRCWAGYALGNRRDPVTVIRPTLRNIDPRTGMVGPTPGWVPVRFEDGGVMLCHSEMLTVCNDQVAA